MEDTAALGPISHRLSLGQVTAPQIEEPFTSKLPPKPKTWQVQLLVIVDPITGSVIYNPEAQTLQMSHCFNKHGKCLKSSQVCTR